MIAQARFLEVRSAQDGGEAVPEGVKLQLTRSYHNMLAVLRSQLSRLMSPKDSAKFVTRMIDDQLPLVAEAPPQCKELAFERHADVLASTLTTLAKLKVPSSTDTADVGEVYILAQPLASAFLTLSTDLRNSDANITTSDITGVRFHISKSRKSSPGAGAGTVEMLSKMAAGMYFCTRKSDGRGWEMVRAVAVEESHPVVLCVGGEVGRLH
eukprot:1326628-Amorphochlora_amoeboformis.AAC.2